MLNLFGKVIGNNTVSFLADFFAVFYKIFGVRVVNLIKSFFVGVLNLLAKYIWFICKWILAVIDVMQVLFTRVIGLDSSLGSNTSPDEYITGLKTIAVSNGTNYYDYIIKIFKAVAVVAIILMIIFTIFAMIMQEYKLVVSGGKDGENGKGKFLKIMLKNVILMALMPLIFYTLIVGTNSMLASFAKALNVQENATIGGNVLAASTYDANRYRAYANADKRIPITISVYANENAFGNTKSDSELLNELKKGDVQSKLRVIAGAYANNNFLSFKESTIYKSDSWTNYANYSMTYGNTTYDNMGQYFENFICTREQYYVMADFVDFCERYGISYYIKAMSESDICWKYVNDASLELVTSDSAIDEDGNSYGDITLNVTYKDAESVNNPTGYTGQESTYSMQISTKLDMTSPISDALTTASKLLGIEEDSSKYNVMERDDSGDFDNLVNWSTRKVHLKLSEGFSLTNSDGWNYSDQIIVYEKYRFIDEFASTNNTLQAYSIDDLKNKGAYLDVLEMTYRNFNSNTSTYADAETLYCVKINGSYYRVEEDEDNLDEYGHAYFKLMVLDETTSYFSSMIIVEKQATPETISLSANFNINKKSTWEYFDQVLVYEYFKDLSLSNGLVKTYQFDDFKNGVDFDVYKITKNETTKDYVSINGTFYQKVITGSPNFLTETEAVKQSKFTYELTVDNLKKYGLDSLGGLVGTPRRGFTSVNSENLYYQKYNEMDFKLSDDFSFYSSDTWTYRDYALVYFYCKCGTAEKKISLDTLRVSMLGGEIGYDSSGKYWLKVVGTNTYYLDLEILAGTSQLPIVESISSTLFNDMALGSTGMGLVSSFNAGTDLLLKENTKIDSYTYYLSEDFNRYSARTWSCGDYLMIYLIDAGIIDTELSLLQYQGYTAFIYTSGDTRYFRFGKPQDENAYFLSEKVLTDSGYTVEKWLRTDLMSFMLSYYGKSSQQVKIAEKDFAGGSIDDYESFIYEGMTDYKNKNSLQYILGKDLVGQDGVLTEDALFTYKYSNPQLVSTDPTTWNILDEVIFECTGTMPTSDNPYETMIVKLNSKTYMYVEGVLIQISDRVATACIEQKTQIFSKGTGYSGDLDSVSLLLGVYYKKNFINSKVASDKSDEIKNTGVIGTFYYYYNGETYTAFDTILNNSDSSQLNVSGYKTFDAYRYMGSTYIQVGSNLFSISDDVSGQYYYEENYLSPLFNNDTKLAIETDGTVDTSISNAVTSKLKELGFTESKIYKVYNVTRSNCILLENGKLFCTETKDYFKINISDYNPVGTEIAFKNVSKPTNLDPTKYTIADLIGAYLDPNQTYLHLTYTINDEDYGIIGDSDNGVFLYYYNGKNYAKFSTALGNYYVPIDMAGTSKTIFDTGFLNKNNGYAIGSGSELENILNNGGYETDLVEYYRSVNNNLKDSRGNSIIIYKLKMGNSETVFYAYGASNTEADGMQYVQKVDVNSETKKSFEASSKSSGKTHAGIYNFETASISKASSWTMLDFLMSYATGSTLGSFVRSFIYYHNENYYVKVDDYYILLPNTGDLQLKYISNDKEPEIDNSGDQINGTDISKTLFGRMGDLGVATGSKLKTFTSMGFNINAGRTELSTISAQLANSTTITRFSDNFDASDYSTWTLSDYILYYNIVQKGIFENTSINVEGSFEYYSNWTSVETSEGGELSIRDLTELDLIIAHISWLVSVSSDKDNADMIALPDTQSPYNFQICTAGGSSYLIYRNGVTNYYIPFENIISVEFSSRSISSLSVGKTLTKSAILEKFKTEEKYTKYNTSIYPEISGATTYTDTLNSLNFQTFVNASGVTSTVGILFKQDPNTGSVEVNKAIRFGNASECYIYDKFYDFQSKAFLNGDDDKETKLYKENDLAITTVTATRDERGTSSGVIYFTNKYEGLHPDFNFDNYYYFDFSVTKTEVAFNDKLMASDEERKGVEERKGDTNVISSINLRLSEDFKIDDVSSWTVLDYIIIREFAKIAEDPKANNIFNELTLDELQTKDFINESNCLYEIGGKLYLALNNSVYNVTGCLREDSDNNYYANKDVKKVGGENISAYVKSATPSDYSFKVLAETIGYSFVSANIGVQYTTNKDCVTVPISDTKKYYLNVDTNVADTNYRINTGRFGTFSTTTIIKETSWVEKLMTDMQVYYPDLNWGVLIATDGWIDTLGDYVSADLAGLITGGDSSANTTASGIVLSEFFMSVATPVTGSYADYEYSSVFDMDTIKALMLSLMGEENYTALVFEAEVFMDYFNSCFAPIIDDFAKEFGESIGENSLRLSAYKSYLATLLLSSEIGEYLYKVATRVYAEYTICEYLAAAGGDYAGYYGYVNNLTDEKGNTIDSYTFGSFIELVKYENEYCGSATPTFTFNYKKAFEKYKDKDSGKVIGYTYDESLSVSGAYEAVCEYLIGKIEDDYKIVYLDQKIYYQVSEQGTVIDPTGKEVDLDGVESPIYCYMLHVYYSIKQELGTKSEPIYLDFYKRYIDGELSRWNIVSTQEIETADQYYENYSKEKSKLSSYRLTSCLKAVRLFLPGTTLGTEDSLVDTLLHNAEMLWNIVKFYFSPTIDNFDELRGDYVIPLLDIYVMFKDNESILNDISNTASESMTLFITMMYSEDTQTSGVLIDLLSELIETFLPGEQTTESAWESINSLYASVSNIVAELSQVRAILPGETTQKGSTRDNGSGGYYTDDQIDVVLKYFQELEYDLGQYISAQTHIDQMQKRSVTFTLAQFGANYVSSGYEFSVKNKTYTFKATTDPSRLAEYVYGGAFLESVGVGAQYTTAEFEGMIHATKYYDANDKVLKTNLETWPELRAFASKLADKTAELYFMTNLKDLDYNTKNAVKIDDEEAVSIDNKTIQKQLLEYIEGQISGAIFARLVDGKNNTSDQFKAVANYIFSNSVTDEEFEDMTLEDFKRIVVRQLIKNEDNGEESAEERANRYMCLFNLLSVQVEYSRDGTNFGRIVKRSDYYDSDGNKLNLRATLSSSYGTLETVKTLAGLENRPTREVLTRQYSGLRVADYFDESFGDTFVACYYKDGLYYPIMCSDQKDFTDINVTNNVAKQSFVTQYASGANIIVCRGAITADGYPTAIRKYNNPVEVEQKRLLTSTTTVYNSVTYYRTGVGAYMGAGDDLIDASKAVGRVTTKNYTKYVYGTSFTTGIGSANTYTGRTNLRTIVKSDISSYYIQSRSEYLQTQADDAGGISILDDFSNYYVFGAQSWILLMLAFVTVIPVMVNACGGAITRIFDMIILFISSPIVLSMGSLSAGGDNKAYKTWKKNLTTVLLGVFGYIIAFMSYSIMIPMIYNVNQFVSLDTYNSVMKIAGFGKIFSYPTINALVRSLWMITAISILDRVPKLIMPILTASFEEIDSPHPGLGSDSRPFTEKVKEVGATMEKTLSQVTSIVSGKALLGMINEAKTEALNMIPGYEIAHSFKEKYVDPIKDKIKQEAYKAAEKAAAMYLESTGVPPEVAKAAAKKAMDVQRKSEEQSKKQKERMKKYQEEFKKNFM